MNQYQNPILKFSRIPEEELMESEAQVEAYSDADFAAAHQTIVHHLLDRIPQKFNPESILDLGAGSGDMTMRLFEQFQNAHLTVVDGSKLMLEKNESFLKQRFPSARVLWQKINIQKFIPEQRYELIFSNSLLHHVSDPYEFWAVIQRATDENSFVFICDLFRPETFTEVEALVELYAKNESPVLKNDFYNSLLAAYRIDEIEQMLRNVRLDHKMKVDQISDRHWICCTKQSG